MADGSDIGNRLGDPADERAALIDTVREWGYGASVFNNHRALLEGRHLLDIGMGGGPYSVAAIEQGGCASYVGVDPNVGSGHVRNLRALTDPTQPAYCPFPYSPAEIMRLYPNVHLYADILENVKAQVRSHHVDMGFLVSVTEHIQQLPEVFEAIWETLQPGALLWFGHHGYHSWTGHHANPREVADWSREDPAHNAVTDWKHLEPDHPYYSNQNFNRVRLADMRLLVDKYFDVLSWRYTFDAVERLTPELRRRYRKYTIEELVGRTATVLARRRDTPLDTDLSAVPFHHPPEDYLADANHEGDSLERYRFQGSAFFVSPTRVAAHTDNDCGAAKLFAVIRPGDALRLTKGLRMLERTVATVPTSGTASVIFDEPVENVMIETSRTDWQVAAYRQGTGAWQMV